MIEGLSFGNTELPEHIEGKYAMKKRKRFYK